MMRLNINGQFYEVKEDKPLIRFLRDELNLTSVKDGCSEGACGTCTIIADGKAVKSCVLPCSKFADKEIITSEGLSEFEKKVYSYAFGVCGAVQCGFCTPGMVMCAKALIDSNPNPTYVEVAAAIRGNICRCTGYKKIIEAVLTAAKLIRECKDETGKDNVDEAGMNEKAIERIDALIKEADSRGRVGENFYRIDAKDKSLGIAEYVDDIRIDGMIVASALRAPCARALIKKIDFGKAEKLEGVVAIFTAKDVPGSRDVGHLKHDWTAIIDEGETTRYIGDVLCIVVAENQAVIEKAKALIEVDYDELEPVTDPYEALKDDAPLVHAEGNLLAHEHLVRGNADEAIKKSAYKVTTHFETPFTEHAFLEPEAAVAFPFDDGVFIYSSDQGTYDTRRETSILLGLAEEKIVVENKMVGGGFGGKEDVTVQHLCALAAYLTKKPVKMKLSRRESIMVHPKRHPMSMDVTTACDENGILTAMKAVIVADTGAYASLGGPVLQRACTHAAGPYNYQIIDIDGKAVYTNNPPAGAFRGFGVCQTCFATESNINKLAKMVGISTWEIRYRNAIRPGQVLPNGQIADDATGLVETLEAVKKIYDDNPGAGIACAMKNAGTGVGIPDIGRARLVIEDSKVSIYAGASCIGQGMGTVLCQMVCETLGVTSDSVIFHAPNTSLAPNSGTTSGSRQTLITGEAVRLACVQILKELGYDEEYSPNDSKEGSKIAARLAELEGREFNAVFDKPTDKMGCDKPNPVSHIAYGYATQMCILDENMKVKEIIAAHDVGRAINPKSVEGQIEGGAIMSMGYALTERFPLDKGVPTARYGTLGLLRADQVPKITSIIVERPGIAEAYGAIGIGEITSIPTAPAIAGAYYEADGVFRTSLPLEGTPYHK